MTLEGLQSMAGEEISAEQILMEFFKKKNKEFTTEILQPVGMSVLDMLVPYFAVNFGELESETLKHFNNAYRINMIAHKRKRAEEVIKALSAQLGKPDESQGMLEKLLHK